MLATFFAFLGALIPASIKAWLAARKAPEIAEAEKAGAAEQRAADATAAAQTEAAVVDASTQAATTQAALVAEMNKGMF